MKKQTIITVSGKAQHGKDTCAKIISDVLIKKDQRVLVVNYANYLKYLASNYFGWDGNKDEKGRTLLQTLGTEKIRSKYPDFWVNNVVDIAKIFEDDFDYIIIPDTRFLNEITRWKEESYKVISVCVQRPNFDNGLTDEQKKHKSEIALNNYKFDYILVNDSLDSLESKIKDDLLLWLGEK